MGMSMTYRAIAFDTGGTVLDWHSGLMEHVMKVHAWQSIDFDRHAFVNTWRRNTMTGIVGQVRPGFHMDDVHWRTLARTIEAFNLPMPAADAIDRLWRGWHQLRTWPDFGPALTRLRQYAPVLSFTMLPTALVVDVSRLNGISWDAVISCQMIGVYKPHPEAYQTMAQWLALPPPRDTHGGLPQFRPERCARCRLQDGVREPTRRMGASRAARPVAQPEIRPCVRSVRPTGDRNTGMKPPYRYEQIPIQPPCRLVIAHP